MLRRQSLINLDLNVSKALPLIDYKLLVVRHSDLRCSANADGDEVVDPAADEECTDGPDPGAEGEGGGDEEDWCEDENGSADPEGGEAECDDDCESDDPEAEGSEDGDWNGGEGCLGCEERLKRIEVSFRRKAE